MEFCPYYMISIIERSIVIMLNYLGMRRVEVYILFQGKFIVILPYISRVFSHIFVSVS